MAKRPSFRIGIEEEFQVIDPETRELKSHVAEMFAAGESRLKDQIKREMHQSVIEVGTPVCADIHAARTKVTRLRSEIIRLGRENGVDIAAAGTHPFTHRIDVSIMPNPQYQQLIDDLQIYRRVRRRSAALGCGSDLHENQPLRFPSGTLDREAEIHF